jgi:TrmH family RNA methyltransferase
MRTLRRDRSLRDEERVFVAEGVHLAREAVRAGADVELAIHSDRLLASAEGKEVLRGLGERGVPVHTCSEDAIRTLQDARSPQPVLVLARASLRSLDDVLEAASGPPLLVVAVGVQDPGNLGALVRTADAAGATGLVTTGESADLHHPRAVRATMGSIFRLPVAACGLEALLERLAALGIRTVGTSVRGGTPHDRHAWAGPTALFLGGEGGGLPDAAARRLDAIVHVAMREGVESLSVGAAAAVLLFEAKRQRSAADLTERSPAGE